MISFLLTLRTFKFAILGGKKELDKEGYARLAKFKRHFCFGMRHSYRATSVSVMSSNLGGKQSGQICLIEICAEIEHIEELSHHIGGQGSRNFHSEMAEVHICRQPTV